jgi:hypothetical protein
MAFANGPTVMPSLRSRQAPTAAATATPPQMPRPPVQTANTPYQTCGMSLGVVMSK